MNDINSLTPRLLAVMSLWNQGKTSYEVSSLLGLSRNSVVSAVSTLVGKGLCQRRKNEFSKLKGLRKGWTTKEKSKTRKFEAPKPKKISLPKVTIPIIAIEVEPVPVPIEHFFVLSEEGPNKTIDKLTMHDCRWMTDDETYCAKPAINLARPWCAEHYPIVYKKMEKKKVSSEPSRRQSFQWSNRASVQMATSKPPSES